MRELSWTVYAHEACQALVDAYTCMVGDGTPTSGMLDAAAAGARKALELRHTESAAELAAEPKTPRCTIIELMAAVDELVEICERYHPASEDGSVDVEGWTINDAKRVMREARIMLFRMQEDW